MERGSSCALGSRTWFKDISTWTYLLSPEFRMTHTRLPSLWWSSQGSLRHHKFFGVISPSQCLLSLSPSCLNCWVQGPILLGPQKPAVLIFLQHCFGSCQTWHIKRCLLRHQPRIVISHNITTSLLDWLLKVLPKLNQSYFSSLLLAYPSNLRVWSLRWAAHAHCRLIAFLLLFPLPGMPFRDPCLVASILQGSPRSFLQSSGMSSLISCSLNSWSITNVSSTHISA